jgi:hypothetical protein
MSLLSGKTHAFSGHKSQRKDRTQAGGKQKKTQEKRNRGEESREIQRGTNE